MKENTVLVDMILNIRQYCCLQELLKNELNLKQSEIIALSVFVDNEMLTNQEFALRMGLSPSRSSRIADRLIKKGLLARAQNIADRRKTAVVLTEKGRQTAGKLLQKKHFCEERLRTAMTEQEFEMAKHSLKMINQILTKEGEAL